MPLTDTAFRNAKGREKPYKLSDGGGLHLLVNPDGARYWRMAYRYQGRQKTLALGVYPIVSLADARMARDTAKKLLARDFDPSQARKDQKRGARRAACNHAQYLPERRRMMQQWADYLDDVADGAKVIVHWFGRSAG